MSKKLKTFIFYTITFGAAIYLLWHAYMSIEPIDDDGKVISRSEFLINTLKQGDFTLLLASVLCAILAHIIRAERWKLLLSPLGHEITLKQGFLAVMTGYFVNLAIPRGGEVSRSVALNSMNKSIPVDTTLGSIVAERVIDLLFLILCTGIGFMVEWNKLTVFFKDYLAKNEQADTGTSWLLIALIVAVALGIITILVFRFNKKANTFFKEKILGFLLGLKTGFLSVFKLKKAWLFILYSLLIWVLYYLMTYTVLKAFPTTSKMDLLAALSIFAIGGVAMAIPMPGGTGSYHQLVSFGLISLYAVGSSEANAFAIIFHGWQTIVVILVGAVCMIISNRLAKAHKNERSQLKNTSTN